MESIATEIIQSVVNADIPLEINLASVENPIYFRQEFWKLVPDSAKRIVGYDAHSIGELKSKFTTLSQLRKMKG